MSTTTAERHHWPMPSTPARPAPSPPVRPIPCQIAHGSFVWAVELATRPARDPFPLAADSYPLVAGFAAEAPAGAALQLRVAGGPGARIGPLLVGRARSEEEAVALAELVGLTLPPRIAADPLDPQRIPGVLAPFDLAVSDDAGLVELRRVAAETDEGTDAVVGWGHTAALDDLGTAVGRSPVDVICCVHLERVMNAPENADPLALNVRVVLVAPGALPPGLATLVGVAVAGIGGDGRPAPFTLTRPCGQHERDVAVGPIDTLRSGGWGIPDNDPLGELRFAFGASDAAQVFRLPGGTQRSGERRATAIGGRW